MDSAKKRVFHHKKKEEDEEEKKVKKHDDEEEELDPLDDESQEEEHVDKSDKTEESEDMNSDDDDKTPAQAHPAVEEVEDEQPSQDSGPKINFDYPQQGAQSAAFSQAQGPRDNGTLDDLANQQEEEYDQPSQPSQVGGPAPRPVNPYAQQQPASEDTGFGIKSIRQPQPGPSFPGGQNMNGNGNGNGNGNFRPSGQYGPQGQGNFNFRQGGGNYRSNSSSKVYFLVLLVIGLVVLGGAVYLLKNQLKPSSPKPSPTPEAVETTPEPSPTPEALDRSQFTIRILNGSGKTGLAAEVSDKLKALGYKIERTGNATNSAFSQTLIRTQDDQKLSDQLMIDLKGLSYDPASGSALKSNDASDGEVILGAK